MCPVCTASVHSACSESVGGPSARPEGGSSSSVAPTTTAGGLSTTADGPPEAGPIARRRRGGHKTPHNVTSHPLRPTTRHFGPFPTS